MDKATSIVIDAKTNYPSACNALETLLLHDSHVVSGAADKLLRSARMAGIRCLGGPRANEVSTPLSIHYTLHLSFHPSLLSSLWYSDTCPVFCFLLLFALIHSMSLICPLHLIVNPFCFSLLFFHSFFLCVLGNVVGSPRGFCGRFQHRIRL
jgi:hypothetical protein